MILLEFKETNVLYVCKCVLGCVEQFVCLFICFLFGSNWMVFRNDVRWYVIVNACDYMIRSCVC